MRQLLEAVQSSGLHMWGNLKSVTAFVLSREKRVVAVLGATTIGLVELFPSRVLNRVSARRGQLLAGSPS